MARIQRARHLHLAALQVRRRQGRGLLQHGLPLQRVTLTSHGRRFLRPAHGPRGGGPWRHNEKGAGLSTRPLGRSAGQPTQGVSTRTMVGFGMPEASPP